MRTRPVSYTHLDVYKRQSLSWVIVAADETNKEVAIGWGAIVSSLITLLATASVSYTHLDVYKRQVEKAEDVEQCCLAAATWAHDRDKFTFFDREVDTIERQHQRVVVSVLLRNVYQLNHWPS